MITTEIHTNQILQLDEMLKQVQHDIPLRSLRGNFSVPSAVKFSGNFQGVNCASFSGQKTGVNRNAKKILFRGIYADNQQVGRVTVLPEGIMNENQKVRYQKWQKSVTLFELSVNSNQRSEKCS